MGPLGIIGTWLKNAKLDLVLGGTPFTPPPTYYFGLSLGSSVVIEPGPGLGYARVPYQNTPDQWVTPQDGYRANAYPIVFPPQRASWGFIQAVFVADAPSGGRLVAFSPVTRPAAVPVGPDPVTIPPGSFVIGES